MRIQLITTNNVHSKQIHLNRIVQLSEILAKEYGAEKLDWLHSSTIDNSCDVFIQPISQIEVKVGFLFDTSKSLHANNPMHWVNITVLDTKTMDALSQILFVTIFMSSIQSVTGSFSVDWADIRAVLSQGTIAYCAALDWSTLQKSTEKLKKALGGRQHEDIAGCVMLLNQGLRLAQTFDHIQGLISSKVIPLDCLTITNIVSSKIIPKKNWLMHVCKN